MRASTAASAIAFALALALGVRPSFAQPVDERARSEARELGYKGVADFEAGRFDEALDALGRAYATVPMPTLGLWSARALVKLGRYVEAAERYLDVTRRPADAGVTDVQERARAEAAAERAALLPRIPRLSFTVTPDVAVDLDGARVEPSRLAAEIRVDPGTHAIRLRRGGASVELAVELAEGEVRRVDAAQLAPAPDVPVAPSAMPVGPRRAPTPGATQRTAAVLVGGVGLAALAAGSVAGLAAASTWSDAKSAGSRELSLDARAKANASTALFVIGGAAAAIGVTLWVTSPARAPSAALVVTPGGAVARGSF